MTCISLSGSKLRGADVPFLLQVEKDLVGRLWGAAMLLCFGAVTAIKIWYWLEMNRLAITREVKRLELHVVQIAQKLEERGAE